MGDILLSLRHIKSLRIVINYDEPSNSAVMTLTDKRKGIVVTIDNELGLSSMEKMLKRYRPYLRELDKNNKSAVQFLISSKYRNKYYNSDTKCLRMKKLQRWHKLRSRMAKIVSAACIIGGIVLIL